MRAIFSVLGLLVVVAIVGLLAKKQLGAGVAPAVPAAAEAMPDTPQLTGTPRQQQQQFRQAVEGTMQQARPMPDDDR